MGTSEAPLERNSGLLGPVTRNGLPREGACLVPAFTSAEDILWLQFLYRTRVEVFCWERKGGMVGVGGTMRDLRRIKDFWNDPWEDWGRDLIRGTQQNCQAASRTCFRLAGVSSGPWARWVMIFCGHPAPPIPWAGCMATGRALHQDVSLPCPARGQGDWVRQQRKTTSCPICQMGAAEGPRGKGMWNAIKKWRPLEVTLPLLSSHCPSLAVVVISAFCRSFLCTL